MTPGKRTLLLGWDGADWQVAGPLIDQGKLPHLAALARRGARGNLASLRPHLSPMLWNSIATGHRASAHGILGFTEVNPRNGRVRPSTSTGRRVKALWNIFSQEGRRSVVIDWYASAPAEPLHGCVVAETFFHLPPDTGKPWPDPPLSTWPRSLAQELGGLRVRPEDVPPALMHLMIPRLAEIDQLRDRRPFKVAWRLAEMLAIQRVALYLLAEDWDFAAVYFHGIDWFSHDFMAFHPPAPPHVNPLDAERYGEVVSNAYRMQDAMLGELLAAIPSDTNVLVVSDHGFQSGANRPWVLPNVPAAIATWHRPHGILVAAGPSFAAGASPVGATLLDVAPTVLHVAGLPVGADMKGRVLAEILANPAAPRLIPSWEQVDDPHDFRADVEELPDEASDGALDQLVAMGYVDSAAARGEESLRLTQVQNRWALAESLVDEGRPEDALPLLEEVHAGNPENTTYALALATCQLSLGLVDEALVTAEVLRDVAPDRPGAQAVLAAILLAAGRPDEAAGHVAEALRLSPRLLVVHGLQARIELARGNVDAALAALGRRGDPGDDPALLALHARVLARLGRWPEAAAIAERSLGLRLRQPLLLALLALARRETGDQAGCDEALDLLVRLAPGMPRPRIELARRMVDSGAPDAEVERLLFEAEGAERARQERIRRIDRLRVEAGARARAREAARRASPRRELLPPSTFHLVSGLPRSGTSLVMQMLLAGGAPILHDGHRAADDHNPEGYLEWEPARRLPLDPELISDAQGKVVKVVSPLLRYLPARHRYRVVLVERPDEEVAASQARMIAGATRPATAAQLAEARKRIDRWLAGAGGRLEVLRVAYQDLLADPQAAAARIAEFLGPGIVPQPGAMAGRVRPDLHRNRRSTPP